MPHRATESSWSGVSSRPIEGVLVMRRGTFVQAALRPVGGGQVKEMLGQVLGESLPRGKFVMKTRLPMKDRLPNLHRGIQVRHSNRSTSFSDAYHCGLD